MFVLSTYEKLIMATLSNVVDVAHRVLQHLSEKLTTLGLNEKPRLPGFNEH